MKDVFGRADVTMCMESFVLSVLKQKFVYYKF